MNVVVISGKMSKAETPKLITAELASLISAIRLKKCADSDKNLAALLDKEKPAVIVLHQCPRAGKIEKIIKRFGLASEILTLDEKTNWTTVRLKIREKLEIAA